MFPTLETEDEMKTALDYFCGLNEETQNEFMECSQVTANAEHFFSLVQIVGCGTESLDEYLDGCDFICQGVKAEAFVNLANTETASNEAFDNAIEAAEEASDLHTKIATTLEELSTAYTAYKEADMTRNVAVYKEKFENEIKKANLDSDTETELIAEMENIMDGKDVFQGTTAYTQMQTVISKKIVTASNTAKEKKTESTNLATKKAASTSYIKDCKL